MNRFKINDWQEMALKKDTEKIIRKLDTQEPFFVSICWEIVLAVGVIIVDHLFDTSKINIWIWVVCAVLAITPPVILLFIWLIKWQIRVQKAKRGILNVKCFVDMFDNQICYWVMMSDSCFRMLSSIPEDESIEKVFVFQEGSYYINKSIDALYKTKPVIHKVFEKDKDEVVQNKTIALYRLVSIVELMRRNRLAFKKAIGDLEEDSAIQEQVAINQKYDEYIISFIDDINQLFLLQLNWKESEETSESCSSPNNVSRFPKRDDINITPSVIEPQNR